MTYSLWQSREKSKIDNANRQFEVLGHVIVACHSHGAIVISIYWKQAGIKKAKAMAE